MYVNNNSNNCDTTIMGIHGSCLTQFPSGVRWLRGGNAFGF